MSDVLQVLLDSQGAWWLCAGHVRHSSPPPGGAGRWYAHSGDRQAHCTDCSLFVHCQGYLVENTTSIRTLSLTSLPPTVYAESLVYQCYVQQMERMQHHFPPNQGVSEKLANLRALVEVRSLCIECSQHS